MKNYFRSSFWIAFLAFSNLLIFNNLQSQPIAPSLAIGYSVVTEKLPENVEYSLIFLTNRNYFLNTTKEKRNRLLLFFEPQAALVFLNPDGSTEWEIGVNGGVTWEIPFGEKTALQASISAGPHYWSTESDLQAPGFLFSDNFEIGFAQKLGELDFLAKFRFRHLSNAGLQTPNKGIDNFFVLIGIGKRFGN